MAEAPRPHRPRRHGQGVVAAGRQGGHARQAVDDRGRPVEQGAVTELAVEVPPPRPVGHRIGGGQEGAVGRVPVGGQVAAGRRAGREVVVVVAVEAVGVGDRADVLEHDPGAVDVAHEVVLVGAVAVGGDVGRRVLHPAEVVHQLVSLDRVELAPAGVVHPGDHPRHLEVAVVVVGTRRRRRIVVGVHLGDAAVDVGVGEHQVLAVGAGEALRPQLGDGVVDVVVARRRQGDPFDDQVAAGVGDEADVADAARLGRAGAHHLVGGGRPGHERGRQVGVAVGHVGGAGVDHLDAVAVGARAVAGDAGLGRRRVGALDLGRVGGGCGGCCCRRELGGRPAPGDVDPVGGGIGTVGAEGDGGAADPIPVGELELAPAGGVPGGPGQPVVDHAPAPVVGRHRRAGRVRLGHDRSGRSEHHAGQGEGQQSPDGRATAGHTPRCRPEVLDP